MNKISNSNFTMKIQSLDESALINQRFVANKENLFTDLNGEAVILSLQNGKYYGVNTVGAFIWGMIQNPASFEDIRSSAMREYEVDEAVCRQEILSFLKKMSEEGLIEILDGKNS